MTFDSPKRKRPDSDEYSSSPIKAPPILTAFSPLPPESEDDDGGGSPRTTVAGKLQRLRLSQWDLDGESSTTDERPSKRPHYSDDEAIMESSQDSTSIQDSIAQQTDGTAQAGVIQQPTTSPAPPTSSPTVGRAMSTVYPKGEAPRPRSPSLKGELSDQYWHESEITGHDPHDPDDDGYGINGIGFKPTSAMTYARLQKRKQQVADYRSREAKEARQRRSDRRRQGINVPGSATPPPPSSPVTPRKHRVRFQDACSIDASG